MPSARRSVEIYEELATLEAERGDAQMRDRFLILAADAALTVGLRADAERLRLLLLEHNPHHLLRPYPSMADALTSSDVARYVADLRRSYPPAEAGRFLEELRSDAVSPEEQVHQIETLNVPAEPEPEEAPPEPPIFRFADRVERFLPTSPEPQAMQEPEPEPEPVRKPARKPRREEPPPTLVESPEVYPYPTEVAAPLHRRRTAEPEEVSVAGVWLSTGLFVLLLVAGIALLVYTFLRPFLPI